MEGKKCTILYSLLYLCGQNTDQRNSVSGILNHIPDFKKPKQTNVLSSSSCLSSAQNTMATLKDGSLKPNRQRVTT